MFINKLNSVFRRHNRLLFGVFTVVVIISFVGFLVPGRFGIEGSGPEAETVGYAFGDEVTRGDLFAVSRRIAVLSEAFQGGSRQVSPEQAFGFYCTLTKARKLGLDASDKEVAAFLRSLPVFQTNGKFDVDKYQNVISALGRIGIRENEFTGAVRDQVILDKLQRELSGNIIVTENEAREFYRSGKLKYTVKTATFTAPAFAAAVKAPGEKELKGYFEANRGNYQITGSLTALVARMNYNKFMIEAKKQVNEKALKAFYEGNVSLFAGKDGKAPGFAKAKADVVKKYIDHVCRQLAMQSSYKFATEAFEQVAEAPAAKRAAIFTELAAKHGMTVDAKRTVPLDAAAFGNISDAAFMKAIMGTSKASCVTNVIPMENGVVIGCMIDRVENRPAELKEVLSKVNKDYRSDEAVRLAVSAAEKAAAALQSTAPAKRAAAFAALKNAKFGEFSFSRMESNVPAGLEVAAEAAAVLNPGENTIALPVSGGAVVARLVKRTPADPAGYEKEAEQCRMMCRFYKLQLAMQAFNEEMSSQCRMLAVENEAAGN